MDVLRTVIAVSLLNLVLGLSTRAEVGYSMRGDAQPFHHWDSAFNLTSASSLDDGWSATIHRVNLRPHVAVWAGLYDNIDLAGEGSKSSDTYWTLAPGAMLIWGNEGDDYLTLNYVYEQTRFTTRDDLDFDSHIASLGVHLLPGKTRIHLSDQFTYTTDAEPELARRTSKLINLQSLSIQRNFNTKSSLAVVQHWEMHDYQDNSLFDYDEYGGGVAFAHQSFPKLRTKVMAEAARVDMEAPAKFSDAWYVEGRIGLVGRLTAKSSAHADVGYQRRMFDEDEVATIEEWVSNLGVSSRLNRRASWSVDLSRRLSPSASRDGVTRVSIGIFPSLRYILWRRRVGFYLRGGYELSEYYDRSGKDGREDEYRYVTGIVDWQPREPVTLGVGFTYTEQDTNRDGTDFEQNHVFVRAVLNY